VVFDRARLQHVVTVLYRYRSAVDSTLLLPGVDPSLGGPARGGATLWGTGATDGSRGGN